MFVHILVTFLPIHKKKILKNFFYSKIFGKYHYYTSFFLPGMIGSLTNCILPSKLGQIHSTAFSSISLEIGIRGVENSLVNTLKRSRIAGTLGFMTFSSVILYYLRLTKSSNFWWVKCVFVCVKFLDLYYRLCFRHIQPLQFKEINKEDTTPSPCVDKIINCESRVCVHNESCDSYIISVSHFYIYKYVCVCTQHALEGPALWAR